MKTGHVLVAYEREITSTRNPAKKQIKWWKITKNNWKEESYAQVWALLYPMAVWDTSGSMKEGTGHKQYFVLIIIAQESKKLQFVFSINISFPCPAMWAFNGYTCNPNSENSVILRRLYSGNLFHISKFLIFDLKMPFQPKKENKFKKLVRERHRRGWRRH